ncbi:MAG: signal peptide protein [Planctomycetaceae bacterium]|nr:signal peptide protein [Planctomycetaceae bacterium]
MQLSELVHWRYFVLTVLSLVFVGCAQQVDDAKRFGKTGKVAGTLKFNGKPVKDARIQFNDLDKKRAVSVIGSVVGGEFSFDDPVPVGEYKVIVLTPEEAAPELGVAYKPKQYADIPLKYRDDFNSDLKATVKEGENPPFEFDMKP